MCEVGKNTAGLNLYRHCAIAESYGVVAVSQKCKKKKKKKKKLVSYENKTKKNKKL